MGFPEFSWLPDSDGALFCLLGLAGQIFISRRLKIPNWLSFGVAFLLAVCFALTAERAN